MTAPRPATSATVAGAFVMDDYTDKRHATPGESSADPRASREALAKKLEEIAGCIDADWPVGSVSAATLREAAGLLRPSPSHSSEVARLDKLRKTFEQLQRSAAAERRRDRFDAEESLRNKANATAEEFIAKAAALLSLPVPTKQEQEDLP